MRNECKENKKQKATLYSRVFDKKMVYRKKQLNCILFNNNGTVKQFLQSVKDTFEKSYLYGKTCKYEDELFAKKIETDFKVAIDELRNNKTVYDKRIQKYILYQMCRTKTVVDICIHNEKIMADLCFDENKARIAGIRKEQLKHFHEDEYGGNIDYNDALETIVLPSLKPFVDSLEKQKLICSEFELFSEIIR